MTAHALPFGRVADAYDRGRPGYPDGVMGDVLDFSGVESRRALEIGAGTGKATELAARQGLEVVAIEPSTQMAAIAARRCASYPRVSIVESTFEDWALEPVRFDIVMSAQAWHWVSPEVRYHKARAALIDGGALALFWSHPRWEDCPLRAQLVGAYHRYAPELAQAGPWFPGFNGPAGAERPTSADLDGLFEPAIERRYVWTMSYSTASYLDLVRSLAEHERLSPDLHRALLDAITRLIEEAGGVIEVVYETRLYLAHPVGADTG